MINVNSASNEVRATTAHEIFHRPPYLLQQRIIPDSLMMMTHEAHATFPSSTH